MTSNNVSTPLLLNNYTYIRYFHYILHASYTLLYIFHIFSPCFSQDSFLWPILQYTQILSPVGLFCYFIYSFSNFSYKNIQFSNFYFLSNALYFKKKKWILISLNSVSIVLESLFVSIDFYPCCLAFYMLNYLSLPENIF